MAAVSRMNELEIDRLMTRLCDLEQSVVYFPVRHHSPASAFLIRQLLDTIRPAEVLIEGPIDFQSSMSELTLGHRLPIAIYSYYRASGDGEAVNRGCYYPMCDYSPEWQAVHQSHQLGIKTRFIDLPWSDMDEADQLTHRYADAEFRYSRYVQALCERLHVEDFDDLWDRMVESDQEITIDDYLQRVHSLCLHMRIWENEISYSDKRREQFMAQQIRKSKKKNERLLVITGGFHSSALAARLEGFACPGAEQIKSQSANKSELVEKGISLTTYSYERLDGLTGYNSGMPSPGFYEYAWQKRLEQSPFDHHPLLEKLVKASREKKQVLNTADLIAVESSAKALAAIRGRKHVWRRDLIDAVVTSLVKDELEYGVESPFVQAVQQVLRGDQRGQLHQDTKLPPLAGDIHQRLEELELTPTRKTRKIDLDLMDENQALQSRVLHQLSVLEIQGFRKNGGTDFHKRTEMEEFWESWTLRWSPEFEASCIEAAKYGTSLAHAVTNRFQEMFRAAEKDSAEFAQLLVLAAQTGAQSFSQPLIDLLQKCIHSESRFESVTSSLRHLLFLYHYDEVFGTQDLKALETLIRDAFVRSLWLLESLGSNVKSDGSTIEGLFLMLETFQQVGASIDIDEQEYVSVLTRIQADSRHAAQIRGGCSGTLWAISRSTTDQILELLLQFSNPAALGDFLTGLFMLAREATQRDPELIQSIDETLLAFDSNGFQTALPSLRLAFSRFTPKEKHLMLTNLFQSLGTQAVDPLEDLPIDHQTAAEALAIEERLYETLNKYGLEQTDDWL